MAWGLATYFIVPVLAFDNLSPIEAVRRSAQLFRKTWGEDVVGRRELHSDFHDSPLVRYRPVVCDADSAVALSGGMMATDAVLLAYILVVSAVMSATTSIYKVALYNYALGGRVHGGFSEEQFQSAWVPKS